MTAVDTLRTAADLIRERGHHRGDYVDQATGALCAVGAIWVAVWGRPDLPTPDLGATLLEFNTAGWAEDALSRWVWAYTPYPNAPRWNDASTAEEVIVGLLAAAAADPAAREEVPV
jgi:hypothetical protein